MKDFSFAIAATSLKPIIHIIKKFIIRHFTVFIVVLFLIPFACSVYLFVNRVNSDIKFIEKERLGFVAYQSLFKLMLTAQKMKGLIYEESEINLTNPELADVKGRMQRDIFRVDTRKKVIQELGISENWKKTKNILLVALSKSTFENQEKATAALKGLMRETVTQSNLILDPHLKTYFSINIITVIIPSLEEELNSVLQKLNVMVLKKDDHKEKKYHLLEIKGRLDDWISMYSYSLALTDQNNFYIKERQLNILNNLKKINLQLKNIAKNEYTVSEYRDLIKNVTVSLEILKVMYTEISEQLSTDLQQRIYSYKLYRIKMLMALATVLLLMTISFIYSRRIRKDQEEVDKASCTNAILSTVADGIITINSSRKIVDFNQSAERIFGYQSSEVIGKNINKLMIKPYVPKNKHYWQQLNVDKPDSATRTEVKGRRKDGSLFDIDLAVGAFSIQEKKMFVASIHDITDRKEAERIKNELVSVVSHELRTPLTSIRGSLSLILEEHSLKLSQKKNKELLAIAYDNCERLMFLIDDILDLDKMESGQMSFEIQTEGLAQLTKQAVEANTAYANKLGVKINLHSISSDFKINVDSLRFTQVLSNLLSNAAKFSQPNQVVDVYVTQKPERFRISIEDYGCGISEAFHKRIFEKFAQEDSLAKGGSGLGLNISKRMIEIMNGTIGFERKPNAGTIFWIELPKA